MSKYEFLVWLSIRRHGFEFIPQYSVDKFNIDFAYPDKKIAVEIDGGHFHGSSPKKIKQDKAKSDYLIPRGWTIERFRVTSEDQIESVAKKIVSLL